MSHVVRALPAFSKNVATGSPGLSFLAMAASLLLSGILTLMVGEVAPGVTNRRPVRITAE